MPMTLPDSHPNRDLAVGPQRRPFWNTAPERRRGFHNLQTVLRYTQSYRAARVLELSLAADLSIAQRPDVAQLTASPWFSAMVVARGNTVLFERYAPDFRPDQPHSIMSISKTTMLLEIGRLWETGLVAMEERVGDILPWIGPGYAGASVQDVLNMNVLNDYTEDYSDPQSRVYEHEAASGARLPPDGVPEPMARGFLAGIGLAPGAADCVNRTGVAMYRSANTDVLAEIAQARGQRRLGLVLADLADAAGFEGVLHVACDRSGFPAVNGGVCLTARDLARHGLLIARGGVGVDGSVVGSQAFLQATLEGGVTMPAPRDHLRYSNHTNTDGRWLGHGGYGGQYMVVDLTSGTVALYLSVLQDAHGYDPDWYPPIIGMLTGIACR